MDGVRQRNRQPAKARVTIKMVADEAGVSTATVSRVLSATGAVKPELEERVRRAVAELRYQPNAAARGLSVGSLGHIGVIMPDMTNPYFFQVIDQLGKGAEEDGHRLLLASSSGDPSKELATALELGGQVDGLVLLSSRIDLEGLRQLADQDLPVVLVNRVEHGVNLPMAAADNLAAILQLCSHLYGLGHRKIAYLAGSRLSWQDQERWKGLRMAEHMGLEAVRIETEGTVESAYQAVDEAIAHRPTAIVAFNDLAAIGAISRLKDLGIDVPGQMSVTGFDDIPLAHHLQPHLTTVRSPTDELGAIAWSMMAQCLSGNSHGEVRLAVADLVIRDSTAPAAVPDTSAP